MPVVHFWTIRKLLSYLSVLDQDLYIEFLESLFKGKSVNVILIFFDNMEQKKLVKTFYFMCFQKIFLFRLVDSALDQKEIFGLLRQGEGKVIITASFEDKMQTVRLPVVDNETSLWDFMEILFEELRCEMFYSKTKVESRKREHSSDNEHALPDKKKKVQVNINKLKLNKKTNIKKEDKQSPLQPSSSSSESSRQSVSPSGGCTPPSSSNGGSNSKRVPIYHNAHKLHQAQVAARQLGIKETNKQGDPGSKPPLDPASKPQLDPGSKPQLDPASKPQLDPASKPQLDPASKPQTPCLTNGEKQPNANSNTSVNPNNSSNAINSTINANVANSNANISHNTNANATFSSNVAANVNTSETASIKTTVNSNVSSNINTTAIADVTTNSNTAVNEKARSNLTPPILTPVYSTVQPNPSSPTMPILSAAMPFPKHPLPPSSLPPSSLPSTVTMKNSNFSQPPTLSSCITTSYPSTPPVLTAAANAPKPPPSSAYNSQPPVLTPSQISQAMNSPTPVSSYLSQTLLRTTPISQQNLVSISNIVTSTIAQQSFASSPLQQKQPQPQYTTGPPQPTPIIQQSTILRPPQYIIPNNVQPPTLLPQIQQPHPPRPTMSLQQQISQPLQQQHYQTQPMQQQQPMMHPQNIYQQQMPPQILQQQFPVPQQQSSYQVFPSSQQQQQIAQMQQPPVLAAAVSSPPVLNTPPPPSRPPVIEPEVQKSGQNDSSPKAGLMVAKDSPIDASEWDIEETITNISRYLFYFKFLMPFYFH